MGAQEAIIREFLARAYAEPHRHYHNLAHIHDCLEQLVTIKNLSARGRRALEHAIWWHDAVYDPNRTDNEERSAELCERALVEGGIGQHMRNEIIRLILLTKNHKVPPNDPFGAMMVSIDLSILGRSPAEYDAYTMAIRKEYEAIPDDTFNAGRCVVLEKLLNSAAIYPDSNFRTRYEDQARKNIRREIDRLGAKIQSHLDSHPLPSKFAACPRL